MMLNANNNVYDEAARSEPEDKEEYLYNLHLE